MTKRTEEERRKLVKEIQRLIESGLTQKEACVRTGVAIGNYFGWKKKFGGDDEVITYQAADTNPVTRKPYTFKSKLCLILGDAKELAQFYRELK